MVHLYGGILFSSSQKWRAPTCFNMDEPQKHCAKWKKLGTKDWNCMTLSEIFRRGRGKPTRTENRLVVAWAREVWTGVASEGFFLR